MGLFDAMDQTMRYAGVLMMVLTSMFGASCSRPAQAASDLPEPKVDLPKPEPGETRDAVLAAGCFWCVETVFERLDGVKEVVSGYAGGTEETATYEQVSAGGTEHAEAVKIVYDPSRITFGQLLRVFFATHDPTTKDRQGPDWGRQYRSAIFFANEEERRVAESYIQQLQQANVFGNPIVTTLEPLEAFYPAEQYHQDFVQRNPSHPYVRQWVPGKLEKLEKGFADLIVDESGAPAAATQPTTRPGE